MTKNPAIAFFNDEAEALFRQYNAIDRCKLHADLLALLPQNKSLHILDIGAGSGADAGLFAALGHHVLAAEPAENLRDLAIKAFNNKNINWNADILPELADATRRAHPFNVILAGSVLQYLDEDLRRKSLEKIFSLVEYNGFISLQYPVPPSREHQYLIGSAEIENFVHMFNKQNPGIRFKILMDKAVADFAGRKTAAGEPIFFRSFILQRHTAQP